MSQKLTKLIAHNAEPFSSIAQADLSNILNRIGDGRLVLMGEASHGTSEFYQMRARLTEALVKEKGFNIVAAEADWPDAARIDHYVRHMEYPPSEWTAFARFPTWMWRNRDVRNFVDDLRDHNSKVRDPGKRTGFYGLDLYSLFISASAVVKYLEEADPEAAEIAKRRYGCLSPWESDPAAYGRAALSERYTGCADQVSAMLTEMLHDHQRFAEHDSDRFLDAVQNARLVSNAERYYRTMYLGSELSWNLRDRHMFETLLAVMDFRGQTSKAVVWAHNSHIGNAAATEMAARGEINLGELVKETFGQEAYTIGFGTHTGTVAAASSWDGSMEIKAVRPSKEGSYEDLCHQTGIPAFFLPLRPGNNEKLIDQLLEERLERFIGVIYRPETELMSHYMNAILPHQFDEYIWFDETRAVKPFETHEIEGLPDTYPFGL